MRDILFAKWHNPKGYTQTEFLNMFHSNNPLAIDGLKNGEILLDNGFWKTLSGSGILFD